MHIDTLAKKQVIGWLVLYFAIRIFSFNASPGTPLYAANPINWLISLGILAATVYFLIKKDTRGWLIIAAEIILGGVGSFLEIKGVSLRTILLIASLVIFFYQTIKAKQYQIFLENRVIFYLLLCLLAIAGLSAIHGFYLGHPLSLVLADTIPYLFFLYYFPLTQLLLSENFRRTCLSMIIAAIIGNFIFIYYTLFGFSADFFSLQDNYYHWFRDVASGKVTNYNTGFFRILTNEQLLLVPLCIWFLAKQINQVKEKASKLLPLASILLLAILTINLTRIYFIALALGIVLLFSIKNWQRWFVYSTSALIIFLCVFILTHLASTQGKSLGLEYLGLRIQSIAAPQSEDSSLSRLLLLPKIWEKIKNHPVIGNGLGDTVTVYSPVFKQNITTPHFDWGYLEIWDELGILGVITWLSLMGYSVWLVAKQYGAAPALIALLVINLTSPALFHVMGVILIIFLLTQLNQRAMLSKTSSTD
jgi:O-antigen ligase